MRWKCLIAYDGTDFRGWQSQVGGHTIQDFVETRLAVVFKKPIRIHGSGRTDAGVHAVGQVFHFDAVWPHPHLHLLRALRIGLPAGILIRSVARTEDRFHARLDAIGKRYIYRIYMGQAMPQISRYCWSAGERPMNLHAMRQAAAILIGNHDFTAFSAYRTDGGGKENPVKNLTRLEVDKKGLHIRICMEASGFLYKMGRSLAGALYDVGRGRLSLEEIATTLANARRTPLIVTAPASGLTLEKVFYPTVSHYVATQNDRSD